MWFTSHYFLIGLAGAAIPILIHLLTRDRIRRVAFSTLRFFAKASHRVLRRKRLQEAILVAMRAVACALLALAFARPFFQGDDGEAIVSAERACAVVVDLSASMNRGGMAQALIDEATKVVKELRERSDAATLITFADAPLVAMPLTKELGEVIARIALLKPGHGCGNVGEALRRANSVLRRARARQKQVVLISDLQRSGWQASRLDWKLSENVELVARQLTPAEGSGNVAILEASYPHSTVASPAPQPVAVRIRNFSDEALRGVRVVLRVNDKEVATQKINLRPQAALAVRFRHAFDHAGDNPGTVSVAASDETPEDNVFCFNARVIPRISVLILSGSQSGATTGSAAFFLETALSPGVLSPFHARTVVASKAKAADVHQALVVILADVPGVADSVVGAMSDLLARGGGLLYLPGAQVKAESFNRVFGDLAPCRLRRKATPQGPGGKAEEATLSKIDFEHPIFEVFHRPHHGDLSRPKFTQFWEVTDSQLAAVLARFGDERPAVLERQIGAGTSMMLVAPPDMRWSKLPHRAVFLPFLHQTIRYLAVRTEGRTEFAVGERLLVPEGKLLKDPAGNIHQSKEASDLQVVAGEPGFYALLDNEGKEELLLAVNRKPAEADPATVGAEEITAALTQGAADILGETKAGAARADETDDEDRRFWWYLMVAVIALSVGELFLGNHTLRH